MATTWSIAAGHVPLANLRRLPIGSGAIPHILQERAAPGAARSRMFRNQAKKPQPNHGELFTAEALRRAGVVGLHFHERRLPGTPDIVVPERRIAAFHHSCFFHAHEGCSCARVPRTNRAFWERKFASNKCRDRRVRAELERMGWRTITVWECASKHGDEDGVAAIVGDLLGRDFQHAEVWSLDHRPNPTMEP